ncbi:hypothetical protein BJY21_003597 [Kineosphaera limosa]|uniref:hypothetical protein n=1 Tax=Kineosphaera limosa TaxID=111564 RepID=UPI00058BD6FF|nr:hypothetical protein [Kineosphaera limosa]NYE02413.1 hypothetical protein [Kineosphaera limosa]
MFVGYFLIFAVAAVIAMGYTSPDSRIAGLEAAVPGFYDHASNLVLSCGLVLIYAMVRLLYGARLREITAFTLIVLAANYLYEGLLTLWNTLDLADAHYGAVGALVTWAFFAAVSRFGMKPAASPRGAGG